MKRKYNVKMGDLGNRLESVCENENMKASCNDRAREREIVKEEGKR